MAGIKFIVSDETLNSYGSVVLTSGINTAKFERNPIMLYMHERDNGVIGRWENVHKEGKNLIAEAVFDEDTELGAKVKKQVENGFLRSASIGIDVIKENVINGIKTITQCDLFEISIVDIPANENAVKLYARKDLATLLSLSDNDGKEKPGQTLHGRLINVLGLEEDATESTIISAVKTLLKEPSNVEKEVDEAIKNGLITDNDRTSFLAMASGNIKGFRAYCAGRKEMQKIEIDTLLKHNSSKVIPQERYVFQQVGECMGVEVLRAVLNAMHGSIKLSEFISLPEDESSWSLEQYRKYAPDKLRDNPALYKRLMAEEFGDDYGVKDLDYYRRHEPEYLAAHPELYKKLIVNKLKKQINHGN